METEKVILIVAAGVVLLLLITFLSVYFSAGRRKGRAAERKTAKLLKKLCKTNGSKLINNIYLPLYNGTCEIDHLVIGKFGIFVVETKGISGSLTGSGKKLVHKIGTKSHKLYNPLLQNQTHIDNVMHHLKKGGYKKVPVTGTVVFTDKELEFDRELGIGLDELEDRFSQLKPAGVNPDILYDYFKKLDVTNPLKKFAHNFSRRDWD